jgi:uroporphyrinogen-III synthase
LCDLIAAEGGTAVSFPVLDIVPKIDSEFLQLIERLNDYHIALFISPNAVNCALPPILSGGGFPAHLQLGAVGKATAAALAQWDCPVTIIPPERFDSESLLALPALQQVQDKHIVIFRGVGGREHLADQLRQRGALVQYGECYERRKPESDAHILLEHWAQQTLDIIIITSADGLKNLMELVGKEAQDQLLNTPLLVISERLAQQARHWGFKGGIVCAAKAGDQDLLAALRHWAQQRHGLH